MMRLTKLSNGHTEAESDSVAESLETHTFKKGANIYLENFTES